MFKRTILAVLAIASFLSAKADNVPVTSFRYAGPYPVCTPFMVDSVDVNSKHYDIADALKSPLTKAGLADAEYINASELPACGGNALNWISFAFENNSYADLAVNVDGLKHYTVFIDGSEGEKKALIPGTHTVDIKFLTLEGEENIPSISLEAADVSGLSFRTDGKHRYCMSDVLLGKHFSGISLSPDGRYLIVTYSTTLEGGKSTSATQVKELSTGKVVAERAERLSWMPISNKYWYSRKAVGRTELVAVDPATGAEEVLVKDLPSGRFSIAPTEDFLVFHFQDEGPAEKAGIYQIISPDDRQAGWRSRSHAARFDIATGVMQQLTFGFHDSYVADISSDGRNALIFKSEEILTQRPTDVLSLYLLDLGTLEARLLVEKDGFMSGAQFSPDGQQILLEGSPEAFGRIGMKVKEGQTPSMTEQELYLMDITAGSIKPLTKDFDPCVASFDWNKSDGMVYFTAENRDRLSLYSLNTKNGKIRRMEVQEDMVNNVALASSSPVLAYYGQGASNSDRLYTIDLKTGKNTLLEDLSKDILKDVELGECHEWNFKNSKGETVYGRYYLPPHFDPSKKYPMIVNYYGGCSPTGRNFESRYPHHAYAALGYVVYVVAGPSGATGFGQEWSARHVNTAGEGPAQDIIEGSMQFCKEHPFVNENKVGCIGASYGGFMSEYMPTLTDFFACSVSHAGISDHTSYWGFGYWGYTYSETSMANSYPWSDKELYVEQSPLYRADRINTPLLLIHGDSDTNVPFNESVQLFTALKLLGKETAFVAVADQNHHILDYSKRLEWQNTIWAWFAKWLQDDPTWWDALYSPKSL